MRAELNTLEAMEERRRLNDQKSKFISMASHEFRTPMTSIQMSTDVIGIHLQRVKDPATKEIARHLHIINKEIMRFEDIMNQILLIGKSENDNARLKKSKTCIGSISSRCSETAREIAGDERPVIITTSGDQRLVNVDSSHMVHIIDNLFSNALKFSRGRPAPELNIHFKKESFTLRLKDYGIGIPKAEQSQLFMSFYRASNAEHIKGTGLGLVIIKNLVHLHEGNIKIKSQENIGTEIEILIKG
jgi:signal transduction histidine kinase